MIDLADPRHVHVEFQHLPVKNEAKSKAEKRPIFEDQEVIVIKFVGDRRKELVAPAHEKFMRDPQGTDWLTYAEAFPRHYENFQKGSAGMTEGTLLSAAGFLRPAEVKELEELNVHTVEQLAALDGAALKRLGMFGRDKKNKADQYLIDAKDKALESRLRAENDELKARLAALEAKAGLASNAAPATPAAIGEAEDSPFFQWPDDDLKVFIKEQTGQAPRGTPSHETLVRMAHEASQKQLAAA